MSRKKTPEPPQPVAACSILACQVSVSPIRNRSDRLRHVGRLVEKITERVSRRPADLVVLPELSTIDYSVEAFDRLDQTAETLDGETVSQMRELAITQGCAVLFGMPRKTGSSFRISQVGIDRHGNLLGCYDKLHICQYGASVEKRYFERGEAIVVFDVAGIRFAPIICYDIRIPELSRTLVLDRSVDCILHCGAYYRDESFHSWHAFAMTRAMENQVYLLSLNRAGEDYGDSVFCPPWVDQNHPMQRFSGTYEDFQYLEVDRSVISRVRESYPFLEDRLACYDLPTGGAG